MADEDQSDLPPNDRTAPTPEKHTVVEHKRIQDQDEGDKKGGLGAHLKKHWVIYTIGIGGATLIVAIIALNRNNNSTSPIDTSGYYGTGSSSVPSGGYSDTSDTALQGLMSQESANNTLLQQLVNSLSGTSSNNGSGTTTSSQSSNSNNTTSSNNSNNNKTSSSTSSNTNTNNSNWVQPVPIGTQGYSTNAWFYTVKPGDTLSSIVSKYAPGWNNPANTGGQTGYSFLYNYRNNAAVLQSANIGVGPNQKLPTGLKISL